jgi:pimeloyl-ACP methyl ester carboxylesterase
MPPVRIRSVSLELRDEGDGPAALLLHGFPTAGELWSGVAPRLVAAGFRVLVPDLLGYGRSDAPEQGLDMASQATWMLELLDALGIRRAAVVAHDVGTAAAQILAARAPERVRGLALIDGVCGDRWAMEWVEGIQRWDPAKAARLAKVLSRTLREPGLSAASLQTVLAHYDGAEGGLRLIRAARALDPRQTAAVAEQVRRAGIRSLVLWGDDDKYLRAVDVGEPLAFLLGAELEVLRGGHFLPLAAPAEVADELEPFLKSLPP